MIERELSLKDYFMKELTQSILSGSLKAGESIPSIRDLSTKHNVSRSVIANGLKELQEAGLLIQNATNHYIVKEINRFERIELMLYYLNFQDDKLNEAESKDILEVKAALDCLAIDLIGNNLSEVDYLRLKKLLNPTLDITSKSFSHDLALSYENFMKEFYTLANNTILVLFLKSFYNVTLTMVEKYCSETRLSLMFKASKEMLDALYEHDLVKAKDKMKNRFLYNNL